MKCSLQSIVLFWLVAAPAAAFSPWFRSTNGLNLLDLSRTGHCSKCRSKSARLSSKCYTTKSSYQEPSQKEEGSPNQPLQESHPQETQTDPLQYTFDLFAHLDSTGMINTSLLLMVAMVVLAKLTLIDSHMMRGWTAEEMALRTMADNWLSYSGILDAAPIQTKAVTSATVYAIGDLIAQRTEGKEMGELNRWRILRSTLAGLIGHGPMSHFWYEYSDAFFTNTMQWTDWWTVFPKVLIDQVTWGPFWNNSYIILLGLMKMDRWEDMWADVKRTTVPLVVSGLKLWPLAHCVTYGLVPVENRLLWVDFVEILWVTILATQAAGAAATSRDAVAAINDDKLIEQAGTEGAEPEPVK